MLVPLLPTDSHNWTRSPALDELIGNNSLVNLTGGATVRVDPGSFLFFYTYLEPGVDFKFRRWFLVMREVTLIVTHDAAATANL